MARKNTEALIPYCTLTPTEFLANTIDFVLTPYNEKKYNLVTARPFEETGKHQSLSITGIRINSADVTTQVRENDSDTAVVCLTFTQPQHTEIMQCIRILQNLAVDTYSVNIWVGLPLSNPCNLAFSQYLLYCNFTRKSISDKIDGARVHGNDIDLTLWIQGSDHIQKRDRSEACCLRVTIGNVVRVNPPISVFTRQVTMVEEEDKRSNLTRALTNAPSKPVIVQRRLT